MRKATQGQPMQILSPIPDAILPQAGRLWRRHFGGLGRVRGFRAANGAVALQGGRVLGVIGFRDAGGGFATWRAGLAAILFRPAPPTGDLVIDGIVARLPRRGIGRALVARAEAEARARGRPGLRAEVAAGNRAALAFYRRLGFVEETRGRFGWPWTGTVLVLRKAL
ncbi:GNAT family N-acetyltransferase [Paracoccus siganidrum]|nr:GNAT family N-acetyltransferase [Paracoccus siganidrum]